MGFLCFAWIREWGEGLDFVFIEGGGSMGRCPRKYNYTGHRREECQEFLTVLQVFPGPTPRPPRQTTLFPPALPWAPHPWLGRGHYGGAWKHLGALSKIPSMFTTLADCNSCLLTKTDLPLSFCQVEKKEKNKATGMVPTSLL